MDEKIIEERLAEEFERQEIENRSKKFLDEYRKLCEIFGMELAVEKPILCIIEKTYDPNGKQDNNESKDGLVSGNNESEGGPIQA